MRLVAQHGAGELVRPIGRHRAQNEQPGVAHDPDRPRPDLAELGGRLRRDLASADLALPALAEQVRDVLHEDRVEALAAVQVVPHVHGEDGDVDDGEARRGDTERAHEHAARARRRAERDQRGDEQREGERGEHAEAGGDEIRAQSGEEREPEDFR